MHSSFKQQKEIIMTNTITTDTTADITITANPLVAKKQVHYVSHGVASGKTHATCEYLKNTAGRFIIAIPTIQLISEWYSLLQNCGKDIHIITSDLSEEDIKQLSVSMNLDFSKNLTVRSKLEAILSNPWITSLHRDVIVLCTQRTFANTRISSSDRAKWNVIFDESPTVFNRIRFSTKDETNTTWVNKYIDYTKVGNYYECAANLSLSSFDVQESLSGDDAARRNILNPLLVSEHYRVYAKTPAVVQFGKTVVKTDSDDAYELSGTSSVNKTGFGDAYDEEFDITTTGNQTRGWMIDFYVLNSPAFYTDFASVTILAADFHEKDCKSYLHKHGNVEFIEHSGIVSYMDESRINRDYSNVTIYPLSLDRILTKTMIGSDETLEDAIIEEIASIIPTTATANITVNKTGGFNNIHKVVEHGKCNWISSSSHGLNNAEWAQTDVGIFLSAINDTTAMRDMKKSLTNMTLEEIRTSMVHTAAYQTLGRGSVRTDDYHTKNIKFIVYTVEQAKYLQTKFKGSKIDMTHTNVKYTRPEALNTRLNKTVKRIELLDARGFDTSKACTAVASTNERRAISDLRKQLRAAKENGIMVRRSQLATMRCATADKYIHLLSDDLLAFYNQAG